MRTLIVFIVFVVISISEVLPAGRQESDPLSTDPLEGQVWRASDTKYTFEPSANIGVGLQLGSNDVIWRVNVAKALNFNTSAKERLLQDPGFEVTSIWYHVF